MKTVLFKFFCWSVVLLSGAARLSGAPISQTVDGCIETLKSGDEGKQIDCVHELAVLLKLVEPGDLLAESIFQTLNRLPDTAKDVQVMEAMAYYHLRSGDATKAAEQYLDIILRYPEAKNITRYRIALAEALRQKGDFKQAAAQLNSLVVFKNPETAWALLEKATLDMCLGNRNAAIHILERIISENPGSKIAGIARQKIQAVRLQQMVHPENP